MKLFLLCKFLLLTITINAQRQIVLKMDYKLGVTNYEQIAALTATAEKAEKGYFANIFTKTNKLFCTGYFTHADLTIPHGKFLFYDTITGKRIRSINMHYGYYLGSFVVYHTNGIVADSGFMYYNLPKGKWIGFHENGALKYSAKFVDSLATPANVYGSSINLQKAKKIGSYVNRFFDPETKIGLWERFYDNGVMKDSIVYDLGLPNGFIKTWYKNGNIESEGYYNRGEISGTWNWYHENGTKATEEEYVNNKIKELKCYDTTGKFVGNDCGIIREAYFRGGKDALKLFANKEIWPTVNKMLVRKGLLITFKFSITTKGKVANVTMEPNIEEIRQVVEAKLLAMPDWEPAVAHNRNVEAWQTILEFFY